MPLTHSEVDWDSLACVSAYIHEWANATFPGRAPTATLTKLVMEEIPELLTHRKQNGNAGIGTELADCFILLLDLAQIWGVDLPYAIRDKMQINERRMWVKDTATGHYNHGEPEGQLVRYTHTEPACDCAPHEAGSTMCIKGKYYCERCLKRIYEPT